MEHTAKPKRGRGRPRNPQQLDAHQTWLTLADLFGLHELSDVAIARRGGDTSQLVRVVWAALVGLGIEARFVFGLHGAYLIGVHEGSVRGGRRHNVLFRDALQTLIDTIRKALRSKGQPASCATRACALLLATLPANEGSNVPAADALPPLRVPMTRHGRELSGHQRLRLLTRRIGRFTE